MWWRLNGGIGWMDEWTGVRWSGMWAGEVMLSCRGAGGVSGW